MPTATKQPGTGSDSDEQYNAAQKLWNQENDFSSRINEQYRHAGDESRGSSDVAQSMDDNGAGVGGFIKNFNADEPNENRDIAKNGEENPSSATLGNENGSKGPELASGKLAGMMGRFGKGSKGKGPAGGIIGLIMLALIGAGGGTSFLAGSLLINIKEIFHNDRSDATRTNRVFSRATVSNMFNKAKTAGSKTIGIVRKMTTMTKDRIKNFMDRGFTIKGSEVDANGNVVGDIQSDPSLQANANSPPANQTPNQTANSPANDPNVRGEITEMDFPDGHVSTTGADFYAHADLNPSTLAETEDAFSTKASFYMNKFFDNVLHKFGFSKAQKSFPETNDKNAQDEAFDQQVNEDAKAKDGQDPTLRSSDQNGDSSDSLDHTDDANKAITTAENDATPKGKVGGKAGLMGTAIQAACSAYRVSKNIVTGVKIYHMARLADFALMFLQAADEIKDGRGNGAKTTYLADNLTSYEANQTNPDGTPNPKYNLTATDSNGYKTAAHGDQGALASFAQKFLMGGGDSIMGTLVGSLNSINTTVENGASNIPGVNGNGRQAVQQFCRLVNGNLAQIATACAGVAGMDSALLSETGPGEIAVQAFNAGMCGCTVAAGIPIVDKIADNTACGLVEKGINYLATKVITNVVDTLGLKQKLIDVLAKVDVNSSVRGVDAGNAIAAGAGLMLATTATGYGLHPSSTDGNHKDIQQYISYTQPLQDKYVALDQYKAQQNQFDMSNQYSFLGSIIRSFDLTTIQPKSLFGSLTTLFSAFGSASQVLHGDSASALYNQPSTAADPNGTNARYNYCTQQQDQDLAFIGATGDKFCDVVGVSDVSELQTAQQQIDNPSSTNFDDLANWMATQQSTTTDPNDCANLDGSSDDGCKNSQQPSIDPNTGKPTANSEYDKYLHYCTDMRVYPYGAQQEPYELGSERDQRWYSGQECMYTAAKNGQEGQMVSNFRMWTNICLQTGTLDGATNCYSGDVSQTAATQGSGNIAETAKEMGAWGGQYQSCYAVGGGHGDTADLQKRIASHFAGPENGVDCSGFARAVIYQATGKDIGSHDTGAFCADTANFDHIPKSQAQPGDFAIDCSEHIEVITGVNGGQFQTVGSHTTGCGPGFGPSPGNFQGNGDFVLRYKGAGTSV